MNSFPIWKHAAIFALIVIALVYALPSLYSKSPTIHLRALATTGEDQTALITKAKRTLTAQGVDFARLVAKEDSVVVVFTHPEAQIAARRALEKTLGDKYVVAMDTITNAPGWLSAVGAKPIALGLDLRGGVHFLLQVDIQFAQTRYLKGLRDEIKKPLIRLGAKSVTIESDQLVVESANDATTERILEYLGREAPQLDIPNDATALLRLSLSDITKDEIINLSMEQNLQTLRNRVDELGVAEPVITRQGKDRIAVQLPGMQDPAQAKDVLGRTAALELRGVNESKTQSRSLIQRAKRGRPPAGTELFYTREGEALLLDNAVVIKGESITDARSGYDANQQPAVFIELDATGANSMKRHTRARIGQRLAILLTDNDQTEIISAPVIRDELFSNFQISGGMGAQEAVQLALLLRAGALAAPLKIIEERTVGPSLGASNIASGINSVIGGFAAIALFIIAYYAIFGFISVTGLLANILFLTALLGSASAVLTLPGLAGFALTLGMAIDANVLINERIREEIDTGKTSLMAISAGYDRAFRTILDANITTLIAGISLFVFGSGPVRGFAVVLCLGLLTSMFSAIHLSRAIVNLSYERHRQRALSLGAKALRFKRVLPLMSWRRYTTMLSLCLVLICLTSLAVRGLNLGIDFTGGTIVEVEFQEVPQTSQVRQALDTEGFGNLPVQVSDDGIVLIKSPPSADADSLSRRLITVLQTIDSAASVRRVEFVGPQIGSELFISGALALIFVLAGIVLYLSVRFKWRVAIGAIAANFHDVVFILGLFSLFQWEFNLPVLAATLAILGYSVNESVIIFDRVRENFQLQRRSDGTVEHTVDRAITQTWSRTIITHGSTQLAVLSMLFFGGEALFFFALALTIGIIASIYSSVLIAGPIALNLGMQRDDFIEQANSKQSDDPSGAVV